MPMTYTISKEEAKKIKELRKTIKNKQVDKRLHAVQLRGEGKCNSEIAEKLGTSPKVVSRWISAYVKNGIESLYDNRKGGNHRNISYDEEAELLSGFKKASENGQIVEVSEIKKAYEEKVGHKIGTGHIYYILERHGWRKVMPRSRHPKKASPEAIEASKKLTPKSEK